MNFVAFAAGIGLPSFSSFRLGKGPHRAVVLCAWFGFAALLLLATGCGGGGPATLGSESSDTTTSAPPPPPQNHFAVATYHNDSARSGINSQETKLTLSNVNVLSFGRQAAVPVQGAVFAQPLFISKVTMADQKAHNLVIAATEHDQVYAIDADSHQVMWQRSFLDSHGLITSVPTDDVDCHVLGDEVGITGTPVIDPSTETLYLVAATKDVQNGDAQYLQRLYALRLTDGQDRVAPALITSPAGRQYGSARFNPLLNLQRSALLLENGNVYVAWASHCDNGSYSGWLMSFHADTLQLTAAWTPDPSGLEGGMWMSGGGPSADSSGNIFVAVGNGWSDASSGGPNYGDSVVRLNATGNQITVADYFMPYNYDQLENEDLDLGSGTPLLIPTQSGAAHPNLLVTGGKGKTIYVLDRDNLGRWHPNNDSQVLQSFDLDNTGVFNIPVFWNNTLYYGLSGLPILALPYDPNTQSFSTTPTSMSPTGMPWAGVAPTLSANGTSEAILWAVATPNGNAVLHAYDAADLSDELYNSEMSPDRDHAGGSVRFSTATVANGEVFVGAQNELDIYGLLSQ